MDPNIPSADEAGASDHPAAPGLIENLAALGAELRGTAYDHLQIAALEGQRAALGLVWIVVFGTVVGMLVVATWLAIGAALVFWLIESGLSASAALILIALLNLLGAMGFVFLIRRKSQVLRFPATLRGLDPDNTDVAAERAQIVGKS